MKSELVQQVSGQKDNKKGAPKQKKELHELVAAVRTRFETYRTNRNKAIPQFGLTNSGTFRTLTEVIDYTSGLVDNFRVKPSWKEDWQANISDITLHSKLMAVAANMVMQKYTADYQPRFTTDRESKFKAAVMNDTASYIYSQERNGHMDQLFTVLQSLRKPVSIKFVGVSDTQDGVKLDIQWPKPEEFYPERINTFFMRSLKRCIWRKIYSFEYWKYQRSGGMWIDTDLVQNAGAIRSDEASFFDISADLDENQVEELMFFDEENNRFLVVANDILITPADTKLTAISPSGKLPFTKTGFEPFGDDMFYLRSLAMIMAPTQEAIDYMFNAMFDKTMLDVMRPILVGGINELVDDYIGPGTLTEVADVTQIREMDVKPLDLTAFRVMQKLEERNTFASVDALSQGKMSLGSPTATEIERVSEAARKMFALFNLMMTDQLQQEYDLVGDIIIKHYLTNKSFKHFYIENTKLSNGTVGTKVLKMVSDEEMPATQGNFSPELAQEATREYDEQTEIVAFNPRRLFKEPFQYRIKTLVAPEIEQSRFLKKALTNQKIIQMYQLPNLFNPEVVKKIDVENNKDLLGEYADELLEVPAPPDPMGGLGGELSPGQTSNQMMPQLQKMTPDLTKLMSG